MDAVAGMAAHARMAHAPAVLRERLAQGRAALDARGHEAARDNENG